MQRRLIILIVTLLALSGVFIVLTRGQEDTWLCENGQWTKHGQPANPPPASGCGADTNASAAAPISAEYATKVVYGTSLTTEQISSAIQDCDQRAGSYDTCGSSCPPDTDTCADVCAYVCLLPAAE